MAGLPEHPSPHTTLERWRHRYDNIFQHHKDTGLPDMIYAQLYVCVWLAAQGNRTPITNMYQQLGIQWTIHRESSGLSFKPNWDLNMMGHPFKTGIFVERHGHMTRYKLGWTCKSHKKVRHGQDTCTGDPPGRHCRHICEANSHQRTQDAMTTHRADGMHEEECPTNVADSENIQQLDIRLVKSRYCIKRQWGNDPSRSF